MDREAEGVVPGIADPVAGGGRGMVEGGGERMAEDGDPPPPRAGVGRWR